MEDEDIQDMAYRIAEVLNESGIDASRAEPILWILLYTVYCIDNKKVVFRESWFDADERL